MPARSVGRSRSRSAERDRTAGLRGARVVAPARPGAPRHLVGESVALARPRRPRRGAARGVGRQPGAVREERVGDERRSRPWPPTACPTARPGRASRRTAALGQQSVRRHAAPTRESTQAACSAAGARGRPGRRTTRTPPTARSWRRRPSRRGRSGRRRPARRPGRPPARRAGVLVDREVAEPARPERLGLEQRRRGRREGLRVAGPAEPLVALRAVGRAPRRSCPAATRRRSRGGGQRAGPSTRTSPRRAMSLLIATNSRIEDLGVRPDLGVAEAVEREARLEDGLARRRRARSRRSPLPSAASGCAASRPARAPRRGGRGPGRRGLPRTVSRTQPGDVLAAVERDAARRRRRGPLPA